MVVAFVVVQHVSRHLRRHSHSVFSVPGWYSVFLVVRGWDQCIRESPVDSALVVGLLVLVDSACVGLELLVLA